MKISSDNKFINGIGFQGIWWSVALYQNKAAYLALFLIFMHFVFLKSGRGRELTFVLIVGFFGISMDSFLFHLNFFNFTAPLSVDPAVVPIWLMVLWLAFACTLNHCLSWVFLKNYVAFIFGGVGGALSYIAADKMGAMDILYFRPQASIILILVWGFFFLFVRKIFFKPSSVRGFSEKI